jgi:hypothetical protein
MALLAGTMVLLGGVWVNSNARRTAVTRGESDRRPLHAPVRLVLTGSGKLRP